MTTAHRPTWAPAKGHEEQGGARMFGPSHKHSKLDDNAHMTLKTRTDGQQSIKELMARDFKAELEEKERKHFKKKLGGSDGGGDGELMLGDGGIEESYAARFAPKAIDADDSDDDDDDGASGSDSDDDEDDTAALLAELDRIKTERAEEAARKEADRLEAEALERAEEVAGGNPLLDLRQGAADFTVKRRWDDDVVFKNQTRGEPKSQKRFINDTIRSDFHKRFLNKYIK